MARAADLLESQAAQIAELNDFLSSQCAVLLEKLTAANAEVERLREVQRWIPVSRRGKLPEENTPVLVRYIACTDGKPCVDGIACRHYGDWCWYEDRESDNDDIVRVDITHWRPLPAGPGEGE